MKDRLTVRFNDGEKMSISPNDIFQGFLYSPILINESPSYDLYYTIKNCGYAHLKMRLEE